MLELVSLSTTLDKDTSKRVGSESDDSDSDSDDSDSDSESESDNDDDDEQAKEEIVSEQARYATELFAHLCHSVLTRAQKQLSFDSIVDYLRFLLLTEEYNSRFAASSGYFDNSAITKMPLELARDKSIGSRAERIATTLTRNRALLLKTLERYESGDAAAMRQVNRDHSATDLDTAGTSRGGVVNILTERTRQRLRNLDGFDADEDGSDADEDLYEHENS